MILDTAGYYDIQGYNPLTCNYDIWLGTGTAAAAATIEGARLGRFLGHDKVTADGWGYKARR